MTRHATPADYARLGLPMAATSAEVKTAFRQLALRYHPDRNPNDANAVAQFKRILQSYNAILTGPAQLPPRSPRPSSKDGSGSGSHSPHEDAANPGRTYRPIPRRQAVTREPHPLAQLEIGGTVWADYAALLVGGDRTSYLDPAALGRPHVDRGTQLQVERRGDGYHVTLPPGCRHRWSVSPRAAAVGMAVVEVATGLALSHAGHSNLLPSHFLDATVARMSVGQRGWTVATALVVGADGRCWIDGSEHVNSAPGLTTPIRVERRADGWHVVSDGHPQRWAEQRRMATPRHIALSSATLGGIAVKAANPRS